MAETISRKSIIYDIVFDVEKGKRSAKDAAKALNDLDKKAEQTGGAFASLGKQIVGAFTVQAAIQQIQQFATEAVKLGLKAEGVRKAFASLNNPNLLASLRAATKGTVDDLTLMQAAVRADKFKIPLDQLATLFKFAAQRARETGQEVGFLTESIIDGIGRKSPLILDNLGLRAQDLQDEFKKTGDFAQAAANVINREMANTGEAIDSNAEKVEQLTTVWKNFQESVGTFVVKNLDAFIAALGPAGAALHALVAVQQQSRHEAELNNQAVQSGIALYNRLANQSLKGAELTYAEITDRLKELNEQFELETRPRFRIELGEQIRKFEEMKAALDALRKPLETFKKEMQEIIELTKIEPGQLKVPDAEPAFTTLNKLEAQLISLKSEFENMNVLDPAFEAMKMRIKELEEYIASLRGETTATDRALKSMVDSLLDHTEQSFNSLSQLARDGSKAQLAFAGVAIFANQAQAISAAIASATKDGLSTGTPFATPALIASYVAITLSTFAQVSSLLSQAKAAQSNIEAFAEGEVDIQRTGATKGKDSIPAMIMPGETVTPTDKTKKYKPFLEAIHDGNLEDLIRVNYVEPALALKTFGEAQQDSRQIDYSDKFYRQILATGEGNMTGKRMVRILYSIDKKLTPAKKKRN